MKRYGNLNRLYYWFVWCAIVHIESDNHSFDQKLIFMFFLIGTMSTVKLEECLERIRTELDNVVDFWLKYSHDTVHGYSFYNGMLLKLKCFLSMPSS